MFWNLNSNFEYENQRAYNKNCMLVGKSAAFLSILQKQYEVLQSRKTEAIPVHAKIFLLRKVQKDYTFRIDSPKKSVYKPIENNSMIKISKWEFAVKLGNFYSKQNAQKSLLTVVAAKTDDFKKHTIKERLKKAIDLGNYYSKLNGTSFVHKPLEILSGTFSSIYNFHKTAPIKPSSFDSFMVQNSGFLESYASLQNQKLTVDHIIVSLNEQSRETPSWLCRKYCCIGEEIEAFKEHFSEDKYEVRGAIDSTLFNDLKNLLDNEDTIPEVTSLYSLESLCESQEFKKMTTPMQSQTTIHNINGGWGDQKIDTVKKEELMDVEKVELVVHEAMIPKLEKKFSSVKEICSLIKNSVHNFVEDLQNMDVKYKWQFEEDHFISKSVVNIEHPEKNSTAFTTSFKFPKIQKSKKFYCLNDVFIRLTNEVMFVTYADTKLELESGGEEEVLQSGQVYLDADLCLDCENI